MREIRANETRTLLGFGDFRTKVGRDGRATRGRSIRKVTIRIRARESAIRAIGFVRAIEATTSFSTAVRFRRKILAVRRIRNSTSSRRRANERSSTRNSNDRRRRNIETRTSASSAIRNAKNCYEFAVDGWRSRNGEVRETSFFDETTNSTPNVRFGARGDSRKHEEDVRGKSLTPPLLRTN